MAAYARAYLEAQKLVREHYFREGDMNEAASRRTRARLAERSIVVLI